MALGDVHVDLSFLKRLELYQYEKPFEIYMDIPSDAPDQRAKNTEFEWRNQLIQDIRGRCDQFSLDEHGFAIRHFAATLDPHKISHRLDVEEHYLPEVERLIRKEICDVDQVFFFDWRLRSGAAEVKDGEVIDMNNLTNWIAPACIVHVDQSPGAVLHRVQLHLREQADFLLQGRIRIINVWKPLTNIVKDYPIAFCESSTMKEEDLVECDHIRRRFTGATFYAQYSLGQKWYYLSQQNPDEALLMKMFDSEEKVNAKRCPHSSFKHPGYQIGAAPRRSIEVRALVFTYAKI